MVYVNSSAYMVIYILVLVIVAIAVHCVRRLKRRFKRLTAEQKNFIWLLVLWLLFGNDERG